MRAHLVEVLAPGFDDDLGLGARPEPLHAQALVAELAVEMLSSAPFWQGSPGSISAHLRLLEDCLYSLRQ